jgi:acyl-CoA synthetase (AMP-forming)/AMP-acid ligase II
MRLSKNELGYIVNHADVSTVVLSPEFTNLFDSLKDNLPKVKKYLVWGDKAPSGMHALTQPGGPSSSAFIEAPIRQEDTAFILYTAGTTGKPKGVILTHQNMVWSAVNLAFDSEFRPQWKILLVFPLYHAAAIMLVFTSLYVGCGLVTVRTFDPKQVMELTEKEKVNKLTFPPTVWNFILQLPDLKKFDTSSVRSISSGAETMPMETKKKLLGLFPNAKLGDTYGMSECAATITTLKPEFSLKKLDSVGKPFINAEIRVVDDQDRDTVPGAIGEIMVRGPHVMSGYYRDPEATAQTLQGGWLRTGDLGTLDEEGFLKIVDRKKDMIISGGENIYPKEIEEILYSHPKVLEVAVIGKPDPQWGENVHAVIALREGEKATEQEIIDYCRGKIASFKKPKSVSFVKRLPRSSAGKVLKRVLRDEITGKVQG